ncbi:MAG: glycosyltransferase [Candidatus Eisenbacteria bacterium]|nr:glycosyltransferase [Candidatus Eisenbacteria bacterium]
MRILYYAPIDPSLGQGHAAHLRRMTEALTRRGHEVRWLTLAGEAAELAVGVAGEPSRGSGPAGWETVRREGPPKLRHLWTERRLADALRRTVGAFRPEIVLLRIELFSLAPLWVDLRRQPLIIECNSALVAHVRDTSRSQLRARAAGACERALLLRADGIGVVTRRLQTLLEESHQIPRERFAVIPNGTSLLQLDPGAGPVVRRELGTGPLDFVALFAGNLSSWQGLDPWLEAAACLPQVETWIVGSGTERARLEERARRLGSGARTRFLGTREEGEIARLAQGAQLLLAPQDPDFMRASGGETLKLLFGLACDRPVFTRAPGPPPPESLRIPEADTREGIIALLAQEYERWAAAGHPLIDWPWPTGTGPGRRWVERERTWDHTAARWEEFALSVVRSR